VLRISDEQETTQDTMCSVRQADQGDPDMEGILQRGLQTEGLPRTQRGKDQTMTKHDDWLKCKELRDGWMYEEAAETGYSSTAAEAAKRPYLEAFSNYQEKYGEMFNPEREPETSILEDAEELRGLSQAFLDSIEADRADAKAYAQKVRDWLDECGARARARREAV
jgi:hypothetical protein